MEAQYTHLATTITQHASQHPKARYIVGIAGAPGSGKTTLATAVAALINKARIPSETGSASNEGSKAMVLSMDGFHLPRSALDALPAGQREEAYIRRGAPWTFDAKGFVAFMRRLRVWADCSKQTAGAGEERELTAPTFDHATKDPVTDGLTVDDDFSIVIVEGNYLLLDEPE